MSRPVGSGAILEVAFEQQQEAQRVLNLFHYRLNCDTGATVNGDDVTQILANLILTGLNSLPATLKPSFSADWQWLRTRTQWIYQTRYTPLSYDTGAGPGTSLFAGLPQNCATTITKRGLLAGRHSVGSSHWAGMTIDDVNNGVISAGRLASMVAVGDKMNQTVDVSAVPNALTLVPVIFNRATPSASPNWIDYVVQSTSRVMRRRTVGVGE